MNIYVSHAGSYDYTNELYEPIKESGLANLHHFFLPHEPENSNVAAKEELKRTDVLVAEVSYASTGQGIELGLAHAADVRIVCFYKSGTVPSGALRFVTSEIIEYRDAPDLLAKIQSAL